MTIGIVLAMTKRLTAKQEKFAQLVASGSNQSVAYKEAYETTDYITPKTVWEHASRLARSGKVEARIEELRAPIELAATEELAWSKVDLVREAKTNLDLARTGGYKGIGSANGALELIGRVTGLLSEKQQAATVTVTRITVVTTDSTTAIEADFEELQDVPALNVPEIEDLPH